MKMATTMLHADGPWKSAISFANLGCGMVNTSQMLDHRGCLSKMSATLSVIFGTTFWVAEVMDLMEVWYCEQRFEGGVWRVRERVCACTLKLHNDSDDEAVEDMADENPQSPEDAMRGIIT